MYWYTIGQTLTQQEHAPAPEQPAVVLLTSEELSHQPALPGLERTLHHTPPARDARVCKAEVRSDCLAGTLVLPRQGKDGKPLACGYLVTATRVVLVDDESALQGLLRRIAREKRWTDGSVGRFLYDFFEQLIARDLHQIEKIEDRIEALEDQVLAHELDDFSAPMTALRKETMAWFRYYSQLDDVACELRENENGYFSDEECGLFRLFEERVIRLDFAANQVRAAQPCGRAGRKRRRRVVCCDLPKYLAQNICFYFINVAHESRRYVQIFFRGDLASRKLFPQGERSFVKPIRNFFRQRKCVKNPHISISV